MHRPQGRLFSSAACCITFTAILSIGGVAATQVPFRVGSMASQELEGPILSPAFSTFVEELRKNASIPGISLGVVRLGEDKAPRVQLASWGRKTEDGDGHDLTPDTLFAIASCSKAFLSTSLGLLIDDFAYGRNVTPLPSGAARFDWDTKIVDLLPDDWLLDDPWTTRAANIQDVLGHVSGLPRHDYSYAPGDTTTDIVRRLRHLRTAYELREKWSYNNHMYALGAHLIAKYASVSYHTFVKERLFEPLNMTASTLWPSEALASGKLTHAWLSQGWRRIPFWFTDEISQFMAGPGGVIASAENMVKWLAAVLNQGINPLSGEIVIPLNVYQAVTTARHIIEGRPTDAYGVGIVGYGMGWDRWTYNGVEVISHDGGFPGFSSFTTFSPSSNLGVVVLINADLQGSAALTITKRAFDDALNMIAPHEEHELNYGHSVSTVDPLREPDVAPEDSPPSLDLEAYTGTFTSPGYGAITICSPSSTSHHCTAVLADFASLEPPVRSPPTLYAAYRALWSSHVRLQHHAGDTFNFRFTALFPHGYGKNTTAFEAYPSGGAQARAVFAVDGAQVIGFSLIIDERAVAARKRRTGGTVRDTADAWFAKTWGLEIA